MSDGGGFGIIGPALNLVGGMATTGMQMGATKREGRRTREFNRAEANRQRGFAAEQADIQRQYEERLSSTAYQRSVADMRAAGLNPMMMYGGGGGMASTPSTASPSGDMASSSPSHYDTSGIERGISEAVSSALEYEKIKEQRKLVAAQVASEGARATQSLASAAVDSATARQINAHLPVTEERGRLDRKTMRVDWLIDKASDWIRKLRGMVPNVPVGPSGPSKVFKR